MSGAACQGTSPAVTSSTVTIEYFTDPLCSWSWGFEPQWRRLRFEFGNHLRWRYRMGGLIADWASYADPFNSVSRPVQMAPQWIEVHHLTGMPIESRLWIDDPPQSSYPACIACKAAELQSPQFGERYLRRLREAVMMEQRNIGGREVLVSLAEELGQATDFDAKRFVNEMDGPAAIEAFREDVKAARYRGIGRFPALVLQRPESPGLLMVGYRPYAMLRAALRHLAPMLEPAAEKADADTYRNYWGSITSRELTDWLREGGTDHPTVPAE